MAKREHACLLTTQGVQKQKCCNHEWSHLHRRALNLSSILAHDCYCVYALRALIIRCAACRKEEAAQISWLGKPLHCFSKRASSQGGNRSIQDDMLHQGCQLNHIKHTQTSLHSNARRWELYLKQNLAPYWTLIYVYYILGLFYWIHRGSHGWHDWLAWSH